MLSRLVREKVRPAWPDVCVSAKKFALHAQNIPKSAFLCLLGEFFRGNAAGGAVLGELFRATEWWRLSLGELFRACWRSSRVYGPFGALHTASGGGFARHEAVAQCVACT